MHAQDGGYEVELPKASFITAKEADVGDVARSPAYSTTVNKVLSPVRTYVYVYVYSVHTM